jgi:hypothetical protein
LEGGVLLALSLLLYWKHGGSWLLFILLILAPDLFMIGYVRGPRLGAAVYNVGHTWLLPGLTVALGVIAGLQLAIDVGLIWFAHISVDRLMGYGLKLPTDFKDTHLGRIGRSRPSNPA